MNLSVILFLIGILGFVLNRKNIILMLISIEVMLLAVTLLVLVSCYSFDDILGQTYSIYIIAIAGAESATDAGLGAAGTVLWTAGPNVNGNGGLGSSLRICLSDILVT